MVGDINLQDIMNEVSSGLTSGKIMAPVARPASALTELQAFALLDPLLADLQKQYLDARANRIKSQKDYGADDAMTDMAQWVEDSAWCAMQTRYMEVRDDRAQMQRAQAIMQECLLEEEEERKKEKARDAITVMQQLQLFDRMHKVDSERWLGVWFAMFFMMDLQDQQFRNYQASHNFNRLAA